MPLVTSKLSSAGTREIEEVPILPRKQTEQGTKTHQMMMMTMMRTMMMINEEILKSSMESFTSPLNSYLLTAHDVGKHSSQFGGPETPR